MASLLSQLLLLPAIISKVIHRVPPSFDIRGTSLPIPSVTALSKLAKVTLYQFIQEIEVAAFFTCQDKAQLVIAVIVSNPHSFTLWIFRFAQ